MKVVIATDSFKGTLTAVKACEIIAGAIYKYVPDIQLVIKPMADGGEGTAGAMIRACNGRWIERKVTGPLPDMQVDAGFAWFKDKSALIEMASASGLELISPEQMNPLRTTTYGTGELILAAMEYGAQKILLAVGGSATVDGGTGMARALGFRFLDQEGKDLPEGGGALSTLDRIEYCTYNLYRSGPWVSPNPLWSAAPARRHDMSFNVSFIDGHVENARWPDQLRDAQHQWNLFGVAGYGDGF